MKVREPATAGAGGGAFLFPYALVLATLLHELTHISVLGHGKLASRQPYLRLFEELYKVIYCP